MEVLPGKKKGIPYLGPCRLSLVVSHLTTDVLKTECFTYLLWCCFLTDCEFSCLAMLAKPYPLCGPTCLPLIPNQLLCKSKCAHEVLGTIEAGVGSSRTISGLSIMISVHFT